MKLLDGGFSTMLRDNFNVQWSLSALINQEYDKIKSYYQAFIDAGSDIIITGNYTCTPYYLENAGIPKKNMASYIDTFGRLAQEVKVNNSHVRIAGSIPPFSENTTSTVSNDQLVQYYCDVVMYLNKYVNFFIAETISSSREATCLYRVLKWFGKKIYLSFCIQEDGETLLDGTSLYDFLDSVAFQLDGVFFNCSPIQSIDQAVKKLCVERTNRELSFEIGAYPNLQTEIQKDFVSDKEHEIQYVHLTQQEFNFYALAWEELGLDYFGGSGVSSYIRELRKEIELKKNFSCV